MSAADVTKSDFNIALEAMQGHHLSREGGDFFTAQPQFQSLIVTNDVLAYDAQTVPEVLRPATNALASQQQALADASTAAINDAANGLKASQDVSDYEAKLEAQRQKFLHDSDANIKAFFDKASQLGQNADSATQSAILAGTNVAQSIINSLTNIISGMLSKVRSLARDILKDPTSSVKGVTDDVTSEAGKLLGGLR